MTILGRFCRRQRRLWAPTPTPITRRPLQNGVLLNETRLDRPPIKRVHRGHLTPPRRTLHARPTLVDAPPPVIGRPILRGGIAPRPLPQRLTMVPQERQEARQVIGDRRQSVLRRRVQQEVGIQIDVVAAVRRNQERHAILNALAVQPPRDHIPGQPVQRRSGCARHRQLSTGEMHPPTQDRHCVENYRGLNPTLTTDTQRLRHPRRPPSLARGTRCRRSRPAVSETASGGWWRRTRDPWAGQKLAAGHAALRSNDS